MIGQVKKTCPGRGIGGQLRLFQQIGCSNAIKLQGSGRPLLFLATVTHRTSGTIPQITSAFGQLGN